MALKVHLVNAAGPKKRGLEIGTRNFAQVAIREGDPPPVGETNRFRYLAGLLGSTGIDSGTTNQNVAGSAGSPQEFYVGSNNDYDIRIMSIVIFIGDTAVTHGAFGNVAALANGWTLKTRESGVETNIIDAAKTGGDVILQSGTMLGWGDDASSFELSNFSGTEDGTLVIIPMGAIVPNGIRLGRGTNDRIISVVQDDLTGLTRFTVRIIGYRHYPVWLLATLGSLNEVLSALFC